MVHLPAGVAGWTVFCTGMLLVGYRIHGVDAPRAWIELVERQFTYAINLRFLGGILLAAAIALAYFGAATGALGALFIASVTLLALAGVGLLALQNHARHLVLATAELSDAAIRISSVIATLLGLAWALVPFFI